MPAPDRTVGLPIHLLYPLISVVLLAIASFSSADSVWYVSASTSNQTVSRSTTDHPSRALTCASDSLCNAELVSQPSLNVFQTTLSRPVVGTM